MSIEKFPKAFIWGCSTSAYQIEGSPLADGAGISNWHRFAHIPGNTLHNETGDIACDHYNRYPADIALMKELGIQAYRFSMSWSRLLPDGVGRINTQGIDFYNRLIDMLLENGIKPLVTLYHWDLPQALDERGGWLNRDIADWFTEYAALSFERFDDRVETWATLNEPWVIMDGGYMHGALAPGHRSHYEAAIVTHNLMRAHASAVRCYRTIGRNEIGIAVNLEPKYPHTHTVEDLAARSRADAYMNRHYLDPIMLGTYPKELGEIFGDAWQDIFDEEVRTLNEPIDYLGINYYTRAITRNAPDNWPIRAETVKQDASTYTETGWEVYPQAFTDVLDWVRERYGNPPIYITENGAAFYDPPVAEDGCVKDTLRQSYLRSHILAVQAAIQNGSDIRGYCLWSFMDNYEWALGFSKRFGIVHVNYDTLKRTPKDSAKLYSRIIHTNGNCLNQKK